MEKFSHFHDPVTGQNPFAPLKLSELTFTCFFQFIQKIPFLILFLLGINTIPLLIKIKYEKPLKKRKIISNSVSSFDKFILRYLFRGYKQFTDVHDFNKEKGYCILFLEECKSNGKMILKFQRNVECDGAIFLKYTNECVHTGGSKFKFYLNFLLRKSSVTVDSFEIKNSSEFTRVFDVAQSKFGIREKLKYQQMIKMSNLNKKK